MSSVKRYKFDDDVGTFVGGEFDDVCTSDEVVDAEDHDREVAELRQQAEAMRAALECATALHIDAPGREGPDLHPLRAHGWDPRKETGPMFVARLARNALALTPTTPGDAT
jgi:hypothetical protein